MMELLSSGQQALLHEVHGSNLSFSPSHGGHMAYQRMLFQDEEKQDFFIKAHDATLLEDDLRAHDMVSFLEKEARMYEHTQAHSYASIPDHISFNEDMLILRGLTSERGWHWRAPEDPALYNDYVQAILASLDGLETVPVPSRQAADEISLDVFYDNGWDMLHEQNVDQLIEDGLQRWDTELRPETVQVAQTLTEDIGKLAIARADIVPSSLNHHDARQANIAWHPMHGVAVVDWSWADAGLTKGDTTMFLLDLYKSGHDVAPYMEQFNPTYAKMQLGYWLQRSTTEHMEGNGNVRMQQFISALSASELLIKAI